MDDVVVAGVGIHPFGRFGVGYRKLGEVAVDAALKDANVGMKDVDFTFVANVGAEMAKGQNVMERIGRFGKPVMNVEAACASSAAALFMASSMIESQAAKIILCLGVEEAPRGFVANSGFERWQILSGIGINPIYFGLQAQELLANTDVTEDDLADVSVKNHRHAVNNPNAMYRKILSREEVLSSPMVCAPLRLLMLCAPNEGAAAVVLMHRDESRRRGLNNSVSLRAVSLVSRSPNDWFVPAASFQTDNRTSLSQRAAELAYEMAGMGPENLDVVECQDTDSASELVAYRDLGLCKEGDEAEMLRSGKTALGGSLPVNPSGGLLSKGEPLGASGLGQIHELVQQLQGKSGPRQVEGARAGLGHVMGAGHNASVFLVSQ